MKKLLCAMALCFVSSGALAHDANERESKLIHASYALPREDGEEFRKTVREANEENKDIERQIAEAHADLFELLSKEEFDRAAFHKKLKQLRELKSETMENRDEAVASAVTQLTPQERVTLAHALEREAGSKPAHHHKHVASSKTDQNARSGNAPEDKTK